MSVYRLRLLAVLTDRKTEAASYQSTRCHIQQEEGVLSALLCAGGGREVASPVYELLRHTSTPVCLHRAGQTTMCDQVPSSVKQVDKYIKAVTHNTLP
jgi:hypothetical protein